MILSWLQKKNIIKKKIKTIKDIYKSKNLLVSFSQEMKLFDTSIKSFLKEKMYFNKNVLKKTNSGKKIIKVLFVKIKKKLKKKPFKIYQEVSISEK